MRKHKKLVISAVMAAVLLFGSIVGVALADDGSNNPQPRAEFQERLAENLGITLEELQAKIAEVREDLPQRDGERWQDRRGPAGGMGNLFAELDEETRTALKEDLARAREEMQAKTTEIFESYGIDTDAMEAKFAKNADNRMPFNGFMGPRGRGGICGFCRPPAPIE